MMSRAVSVMLLIGLLCGVAFADRPRNNVIRPRRVDARVKGCQVSEPGTYRANAADLIELEYTFPIVPSALPKNVSQQTDKGVMFASKLGIRNLVVPNHVGTGTYLFYFEPKRVGKGTVFVVIDDVKYEYRFEVSESRKNKD